MIGRAYLKLYPSCVLKFISSMYAPEINLNHCKKMWEGLKSVGAAGHWMYRQFHCR